MLPTQPTHRASLEGPYPGEVLDQMKVPFTKLCYPTQNIFLKASNATSMEVILVYSRALECTTSHIDDNMYSSELSSECAGSLVEVPTDHNEVFGLKYSQDTSSVVTEER
ncbi:hypothetical protein J6590_038200 [Homalodisca vitripennis]|nr:hypothetical protein J6590_038200 [Homalodisca vitripennis]